LTILTHARVGEVGKIVLSRMSCYFGHDHCNLSHLEESFYHC